MSSFHDLGDEHAGDEANEEWDAAWAAYAAGAETAPGADGAPLRAVLHLAGARAELRGDVDDATLELCRDLLVEPGRPSAAPDAATERRGPDHGLDDEVAAFSLTVHDGPPWRIDHDGVGEVERDPSEHSSTDATARSTVLLERILQTAIATDPDQLHLDVAAVVLDGTGVVLVGGERTHRDALVADLLRDGAALISAHDLVLRPGTRTVRGLPLPLAPAAGAAKVPGSSLGTLAPYATVGVIAVLEDLARPPTDGGTTTASGPDLVRPLPPGAAVLALLEALHPGSARHDDALELVAQLVAGATCVELDLLLAEGDPGAPVAALRALEAPERRHLVVGLRAAVAPRPGRSRRGTTETSGRIERLVRFDRQAVHDDGRGVPPALLDAAGSDAVEARLLETRRSSPGPEAFGLPNCPVGEVARGLWSSLSVLDDAADGPAGRRSGSESERAEGAAGELPTGVAAELFGRNLVATDDDQRRRVVDRHMAARTRTEQCVAVLADVLAAAREVDVAPVVVGALVQAFDGPLPEHFTDVDRLDLLVPKDDLDLLAEELERRGYARDSRTISGSLLTETSEVQLHHAAHPDLPIDLHRTLAAGPFGELVDPEEFHRRAVPFRLEDRWALALDPEHRFVHACVRADRVGGGGVPEYREVVLSAPRSEARLAATMECSARWGATTSVLAVARRIDATLPGLPRALVERAGSGEVRRPLGVRRGRRTRR